METLTEDYQKSMENFQERKGDEITILLYHGVTKEDSYGIENYSAKHINDNTFARQMKYISENCSPISIDDYLSSYLNNLTLPKNSVIVSFDDGFRNNYTTAAPILEEFQIPAVFYISSGIVNTDIMFWVDILEDCLNHSQAKNIEIDLEKKFSFSLLNDSQKIHALDKIKAFCKSASYEEMQRVVQQVESKCGVQSSVENSKNYEKIKWNELSELNQNDLFTIGGHSLYHVILSQLDIKRLDIEIRSSIDLLNINLGTEIVHYSYPEGKKNHFNSAVINCLKKYNIICCPTAEPGLNPKNTNPFFLKRIMVGFQNIPFPYY